ncbi:MAG: SIR2 family protein, partial [Coriobacteriia bacterium]|nr:SIR2 family protein [Coriobacteriia bacterium]
MSFDYSTLADHLHNGSLVAFVGAGASRSYQDATSGQRWFGLNGAGDFVGILSRKLSYIQASMAFPAACFLYKKKEGRGELERFLLEHYDRPQVPPSPAHVMLANTSFAAYMTTNFDRLLETALREAKKKPYSIIEDDDVPGFRPSDTPIIKLHGCVTRPKSLVAAEDEYLPLSEKSQLIDAMVRTLLANRAVLFLGFALQDADFKFVFDQTKRSLGDRMPRSYA